MAELRQIELNNVTFTQPDLSDYVMKEAGKGLSTNDFTDADKNALDGYEARIAALENRLNKYVDTILTMTDGATEVDKYILTKPTKTMFDLAPGAYDSGKTLVYNWDEFATMAGLNMEGGNLRGMNLDNIPDGVAGIVLPDIITSIGHYSVMCENPDETFDWLVIPSSVTSIDDEFAYEPFLSTIYYNGTATGAPWGQTGAVIDSEG